MLTSSKACDWAGHIFVASASLRPLLTTKRWLRHSLPLFMAVSMIPGIKYDILDAIACCIRG